MDGESSWVGYVALMIVVLGFLFLLLFLDSFFKKKISEEVGIDPKLLEISRQYKLPREARRNIHKPYDYWDDAGDGSGVNYVEMPDGSVRID